MTKNSLVYPGYVETQQGKVLYIWQHHIETMRGKHERCRTVDGLSRWIGCLSI